MILAAVLRNFKCFKGINIIPFCDGKLDSLNIIIGNNGVGKSAVLEGLNTLFNEARWIINNEIRGKKEDVSVGAVMLIEKNRMSKGFDSKELALLEEISNFFWSVDESNTTLKQYSKFFELRSKVLDKKDGYYFFVVGREYEQKDILFLTFTNLLSKMNSSFVILSTKLEKVTLSKLPMLKFFKLGFISEKKRTLSFL